MVIKKTFLLMFAIALLIPFGTHANDIPEEFEFQDAHKATEPIVIDGNLEEWTAPKIVDPLIGVPKIGRGDPSRVEGDPPTEFVVHEELGGTWTGPADQSTSLQLAWTADGVYLGLIVTDDYHENAANSAWNGDSLQMMITTDDRESDFALYNYALGGIEDDHAGFEEDPPLGPDELVVDHERGIADFFSSLDYLLFNDDDEPNVAIMRDTIELTTTYEIFLGTEALGLEVEDMKEGTQFGLAMSINDGDEDAPGQAGWVGLGAHAIVFGKTPSEAALVTLAGEVVDEPTEPTCADLMAANIAGDADQNGEVAFGDFLALAGGFGTDAGWAGGDFDCSGDVGFNDFLALANNFGATAGAVSSVPEPSSLGLFGFSVLVLGFLRRRRNR